VPSDVIAGCPGGYGPPGHNDSSLFNAMISPYLTGPMAAAAVLWFQGETNASGEETDGLPEWARYACLFRGLVQSWRDGFGPGPDGGALWVSLAHLEPWNAPPSYNAIFSGLRQQQLGGPSAALPSRVTFSSAVDLGDPTSPWHPVHFRNKQAFGARQAAALLATVWADAAPGHPPAPLYPRANSATVALSPDGATLTAVVSFEPATVGPAGLRLLPAPTTPCPVGGQYNFSAASCAWPTLVDATGAQYNATLAVTGTPAAPTVTMSAAVPPGVTVRNVTAQYGWGVWPVMTVYAADDGTPALPWSVAL
jgi:hypothetical protein